MSQWHPTRKIAAVLEDFSEHPSPGGSITIELDAPGDRLVLDAVTTAHSLGVECRVIGFETGVAEPAAGDGLRGWGRRLADRLDYLWERIELQEVDGEAGRVLLRSGAPSRRHGQRGYYQVELSESAGGLRQASMERVAFDESSRRREAVPIRLTTETLERLAEDLSATARGE